MQKIVGFIISLLFLQNIIAQDKQPVQFDFTVKDVSGTEKILVIKAKGLNGAKIVSIQKNAAEANTNFEWDSTITKYLKDSIKEIGNPTILKGADIEEFKVNAYDSVTWEQKLESPTNDTVRIKGKLNYLLRKSGEEGLPGDAEAISKQVFFTKDAVKKDAVNPDDLQNKSLWGLFIAGFIAGLIGFISPCVYALVPVTVSMFMKRSKTKSQGRTNVLFYAASILIIYTLVGILTGIVIPKTAIYTLSTHWIFNLFIFVLFVIFGISFLGAFEIKLPNSWANKMDSKASTKSYSGIFFMAITLVIVSFSCTGPFVGSLLAASFSSGKIGPALGMFGFGLGLAAPFAIFAIFPKLITVLTKSGGWQNALKVSLGFIELALALKFLSNADGVMGWRLLDREIFLILWIIIFIVLGIYLLGKIRFKLDSDLPKNDWGLTYLPIPRLFFAMASFSFALYMIPGLWGAPLKMMAPFLPGAGTQDFNLLRHQEVSSNNVSYTTGAKVNPPAKYVDFLHTQESAQAIENGFTTYFDYEEGLAAAKALKKPLLIDFTGITCVNCRKFESAIWSDPAVAASMKNDFVIASLFTDYREELNDNEKYESDRIEGKVNTVGEKNIDLQLKLINSNSQPNYVFVDNEGKLLHPNGYGYDPSKSASDFLNHLETVKTEFKKRNP